MLSKIYVESTESRIAETLEEEQVRKIYLNHIKKCTKAPLNKAV